MSEDESESERSNQVPLNRSTLVNLRVRALRRGVWFKNLNRIERGLVDLTLKTIDRVRSFVLARSLVLVVKKLLEAMENEVAHQMRTFGYPLAQKLIGIAQGWGNKSAVEWDADLGFVKFLTICHMNKPNMFEG